VKSFQNDLVLILKRKSFLSVLTHSLCSVLFPLSEDKSITVQSGQNVILPCQAPNDTAVAWTKPDLQNKNVYLYRDGRFDPADQNPSFKNRVDLQDRQMKDGDVSLILKDVMINDAGKYECITRSSSNQITTIKLRIMSDISLKRKWILFCSSLITYLTADTSHLFLTCRSDRRTHRGWREGGWIC
uniref:Ig-like domain-containing protein n=1 Tax=Astatotilapia calliptera TaxID=8154 RepID=A0A3P8P8L9_ASTCA